MSPEGEQRRFPRWAERERASDLAWIAENLHILWPVAKAGYEALGRGALVVDTTSQPEPDKGNPFGYLPQEQIMASGGGKDEHRMMAQYDPTWELVTILLKEKERMSSYRIGVPDKIPPSGGEDVSGR